MSYLLVALGGAIGAMLRYMIMLLCVSLRLVNFPYATLIVNVVGSFLMGALAFYFLNKFTDNESVRLFLLVGLLGAFTTFSSFSIDTLHLIIAHRYVAASLYIIVSVVICLLAAMLGMILINKLAT